MEPRREPFRNPRDRPNPISILTIPKVTFNSNSRPFIINSLTTHRQSHQNPFFSSPPSLNPQLRPQNSQVSIPQNVLPSNREQVKCQYCNNSYAADLIGEHNDNCDMRKIPCDKCGDRILIDIFDLHVDECNMDDNMDELADPRSAMYMRHVGNMEDDDDSMESMGNEGVNVNLGQRGMYLPESRLTYESLLQLDNNVVKKGMNEEQLKEFPVQLYVRSLDGEGSCAICISEYETGEYVRKLNCTHKFHRNCVDKWLDTNITCPVCKKYLR